MPNIFGFILRKIHPTVSSILSFSDLTRKPIQTKLSELYKKENIMELNVSNYEQAIAGWCEAILESRKKLLFLTEGFTVKSVYDNRAVIDRNLVAMTVASQKIINLIFPLPSTGEIHGLPKEAVMLGDEPDIIVIDREHPQWDFRPWFSEKSGALKTAVEDLMEALEYPFSLMSTEADVERKIKSAMAKIENKATAILEMIESGRLAIKDVQLDEWEE
jgi:hypothetical protein